jgi:hypothetical protein
MHILLVKEGKYGLFLWGRVIMFLNSVEYELIVALALALSVNKKRVGFKATLQRAHF